MKGCRWVRVGGHGMVRVREDEAVFFLNGQFCGVTRVYWKNVSALVEYVYAADYDRHLGLPQSEVFV